MKKLFTALAEELARGRGAAVVSIVASSGSTPRGAGAKMLVRGDGSTLGTIGGGAVEFRAQAVAEEAIRTRSSRFQEYRLSAGQIADIGMICGGDVRLYIQYFAPEDLPRAEEVLALLAGGEQAWLVTAIGDGGWQWGTYAPSRGLRGLPADSLPALEPLLGERSCFAPGEPALYVEPLQRAGTVYLFGGGHVSRALAAILAMTDFRLVVYDQRPHAAVAEAFPEAAEIHCGPYEQALAAVGPIGAEDYVVVMTPGHQADYAVLTQVLATPAKYIGCIGSRRKAAAARERLLDAGFSREQVDRIHAPIGLPIGGESPAEIAVSIAAQLIAVRSGKPAEFHPGVAPGKEQPCC